MDLRENAEILNPIFTKPSLHGMIFNKKAGVCMGEIRDNIRRNLGYYLALKGLNQKEFAEKLGVSQSSVTCWLKGKNAPDIEVVAHICDILGISVAELFGQAESEPFHAIEKKLLEQYHKKPELQHAIHILLGIDPNQEA